ncbi:MAG: DUF2809 domain-containing protein [Gluconacetobacter diazotrophicus]|nr:DUF2809 domain-containing protein [Gluconacetobacter diazotrophicus]
MSAGARVGRLGAAGGCIVAGLVVTLLPQAMSPGLPVVVRHYAGSVLWGAMLLLLLAAARPAAPPAWGVPTAALLALAVELLRLVHAPVLDRFRAGLAGGLLLGRVFNPGNVLAYWVGIGLAWGACEAGVVRRSRNAVRIPAKRDGRRDAPAPGQDRYPRHSGRASRRRSGR